jgi:hypothetical protein
MDVVVLVQLYRGHINLGSHLLASVVCWIGNGDWNKDWRKWPRGINKNYTDILVQPQVW